MSATPSNGTLIATAAWIDQLWHDRFIQLLPEGASVLDLGCGSSQPVARHLAEHGLQITGVDASPTLISLCHKRLPTHEWIVSDMRTLALGKRFDGILAWDSYFFLPHDDQRAMLGVFAAHAAPSAVLMFNTGPSHGEAIGDYRGEALYHASLDAAEWWGQNDLLTIRWRAAGDLQCNVAACETCRHSGRGAGLGARHQTHFSESVYYKTE